MIKQFNWMTKLAIFEKVTIDNFDVNCLECDPEKCLFDNFIYNILVSTGYTHVPSLTLLLVPMSLLVLCKHSGSFSCPLCFPVLITIQKLQFCCLDFFLLGALGSDMCLLEWLLCCYMLLVGSVHTSGQFLVSCVLYFHTSIFCLLFDGVRILKLELYL